MSNGILKINSSLNNRTLVVKNSKQQENGSFFMELFEHSQVKFECLHGYKLKTTLGDGNEKHARGRKENFFVEKCERPNSPFEDMYDTSVANLDFLKNVDYELSSHYPRYYRQSSNSQLTYRHECLKYCEPFKINHALSKLFLVPLRRDVFFPGEKLTLHCNEGYIAVILNENEFINRFDLDCEENGKWYLKNFKVKDSNGTSHTKSVEINKLPICFSVDKLKAVHAKNNASDYFYGDFSYSELNVRTFSMIILFCGLLFSIVILCLTIINYYSKRFAQRSLLLAQSDPFVLPVSSNIASSNYFQQSEISRSIPLSQTIQTTLNEQPQQQEIIQPQVLIHNNNVLECMDQSNLPSYEEATANVPRGNFNFQLNSNHSQPLFFERAQANTAK